MNPCPSQTPPGTPPSLARSHPSPAQRKNPTIDEIKEAFSELSVGLNSMADRLENRIDEACKVPVPFKSKQ